MNTMMKLGLVVILSMVGCSGSAKQDVKTGSDLVNLACDQLAIALQDEPSWVKFTCDVLDVGGTVIEQFLAKVPREKAVTFAARHERKK